MLILTRIWAGLILKSIALINDILIRQIPFRILA